MSSSTETSQSDFYKNVLSKNSEYKKAHSKHANKASIAKILTRIRVQANLTQSEVARRAGWRKSYVSRLESPLGGVPDATTLTRFADACGMSTAVVFGTEDNNKLHIFAGTTMKSDINDKQDQPNNIVEQNLELEAS